MLKSSLISFDLGIGRVFGAACLKLRCSGRQTHGLHERNEEALFAATATQGFFSFSSRSSGKIAHDPSN